MRIFRFFTTLLIVLCGAAAAVATEWHPDSVLGEGFEMRSVTHPDDYSGNVRSTIIRHRSDCGDSTAVLYIHGYNDYFFQDEEAERIADSCYHFYAVDLRKYGRSLLPGQERTSVFSQVDRIKMVAGVGYAFGFFVLKKIVVVAVDVQHSGAVAAVGAVADYRGTYISGIVVGVRDATHFEAFAEHRVGVPFGCYCGRRST